MERKNNRMPLNREQRAAAFCTTNAVVAAGAGSGKTMVLANRFAWLVTKKNIPIDEILTLTFTRKAAAQMYRRIYNLLGEIAAEDSSHAGARARKALKKFTHARIQTLDSYCASLVRQAAPRYGLSPDFKVDEERCYRLAVEESMPFLISQRHHPAMERLYAQHGPEGIASNILAETVFYFSRIDKSVSFSQGIQKQFDIACDEWKKQYGHICDLLEELANGNFENDTLLRSVIPVMEPVKNGKIKIPQLIDIRGYFDFLLELSPEDAAEAGENHPVQGTLITIIEFLAKVNTIDIRFGKRYDNLVRNILKELRARFGEFSSLAVFCMQAGLFRSVMAMLGDLQRRYINKKRSEAVLTFDDIACLAKTVLLEQKDIRQSEKETFKAIMIDEFQDNNELQKDVLFLLAEKNELLNGGVPAAADLSDGKLFFVGDEKQSIYRFRGADVSVFRRLKNELHSGDLPLATNYRSSPHLIGAFNAIFGGGTFDPKGTGKTGKPGKSNFPSVFAPDSGLPLYEAAYTTLRAGKTGEGKLTLCILDKKEMGNSDGDSEQDSLTSAAAYDNEARFVAERIQQLLNKTDENGRAQYRPEDIAILFRSRNPQRFFEKQLRLLSIPYTSENLNGFFFDGPVNDIMSVLRLAAYPLDRIAYAEMLRSPFAGVSLPGLTVCLSVFNRKKKSEPFGHEPIPLLSEEDRRMYRQGQMLYRAMREKAAAESVSSLVSELWYRQGYRYETEWNPQTQVYSELYDYLFHLAAQADADGRGLAAFTDSIQRQRNSGSGLDDIEIPLERSGAVQLLTVHKSKGLEFPVVFLCCCGKHGQHSGSEALFDTGETGITFNPPLPPRCRSIPNIKRNFFWERSRIDDKKQRTAELRRLLYVGMTRAEKELYLCGCLSIGSMDEGDGTDFSLLLKQYIDGKMKRPDEEEIPGDSIVSNDTFFGLCLPAFAAHIPQQGLAAKQSFFVLEKIPVYQEEYLREYKTGPIAFSNDQMGLNVFFERTEQLYKDAKIIEAPKLRSRHIAPTSLADIDPALQPAEQDGSGDSHLRFIVSGKFSGADSSDIFDKVASLIRRNASAKNGGDGRFNWGGFGTVAHICANALLSGKEAVIPPELAGLLSPKESGAFLEAGKELAARFLSSPLGIIAQKSELRKSEFPFRSLLRDTDGNDFFISGTIDLLFTEADTIHVVDFKTDNKENPGWHAAQMACYYRAVSELFAVPKSKKCRVWLYYLRSGHAVEMTMRAKHYNLERVIRADI